MSDAGVTEVGTSPDWVVLTDARTAIGPRPGPPWRVFVEVGVISALVIVAVAVAAVFAASHLAEHEAVREASRTTTVLADGIVQPVLSDGLLAGDTTAIAALDLAIRNSIFSDSDLGDSVVRVKLWDATGRILYSDEPRLIGSTLTRTVP